MKEKNWLKACWLLTGEARLQHYLKLAGAEGTITFAPQELRRGGQACAAGSTTTDHEFYSHKTPSSRFISTILSEPENASKRATRELASLSNLCTCMAVGSGHVRQPY